MTMLNISNLTKVTKQKTLLKDVNLSLSSHQIYGLIGGNGAGKTTLFRCLLGLSSSTGQIFLDDIAITEDNMPMFLRKVGAVFPFPDSYDTFTVKEIVDDHLQYYHCSSIDVENYLKKFGLNVSLGNKISMFSLGMKQRLNIALACLHDPEIMILDEPFNGLDREGIALLQNLLVEYKQKGKIIMISSHSFSELESISDQIIMIQNGEILATSSVEELKRKGFEHLEDFYQELKGGR